MKHISGQAARERQKDLIEVMVLEVLVSFPQTGSGSLFDIQINCGAKVAVNERKSHCISRFSQIDLKLVSCRVGICGLPCRHRYLNCHVNENPL